MSDDAYSFRCVVREWERDSLVKVSEEDFRHQERRSLSLLVRSDDDVNSFRADARSMLEKLRGGWAET